MAEDIKSMCVWGGVWGVLVPSRCQSISVSLLSMITADMLWGQNVS